MEQIGEPLRYPTLEDIIKINRRQVETGRTDIYVSPDNCRQGQSLEWVLDAIQYPLAGCELYPGLVAKAARLTWVIITTHVFWSAVKRTGMHTLHFFLRLNGYRLDATNDDQVDIALRIAKRGTQQAYDCDQFVEWVRGRIVIDPKRQW